MTYVVRDEADVTDEARNADYDTIDDDLTATVMHGTTQFKKDNKRVYLLLKPLLEKGPGWTTIHPFN